MLGQHRRHGKHAVYEESVRVPLIIRGPGLPAGQVRNQLAANIDLAPTILDATDVQPRLQMDGISLLPPARDPAVDGNRSLVLEYLAGPRAYSAVRTPDGFVYAQYRDGERELYDLNADPYELHNLAGKPRRRCAPSETRTSPGSPSQLRWRGLQLAGIAPKPTRLSCDIQDRLASVAPCPFGSADLEGSGLNGRLGEQTQTTLGADIDDAV